MVCSISVRHAQNIANGGSSRTLLVVTTGNLEDVALELIAEGLGGDLIIKIPISHCSRRSC